MVWLAFGFFRDICTALSFLDFQKWDSSHTGGRGKLSFIGAVFWFDTVGFAGPIHKHINHKRHPSKSIEHKQQRSRCEMGSLSAKEPNRRNGEGEN